MAVEEGMENYRGLGRALAHAEDVLLGDHPDAASQELAEACLLAYQSALDAVWNAATERTGDPGAQMWMATVAATRLVESAYRLIGVCATYSGGAAVADAALERAQLLLQDFAVLHPSHWHGAVLRAALIRAGADKIHEAYAPLVLR